MVQWRKIVAPRPEHSQNGELPEEPPQIDSGSLAGWGEKIFAGVLFPTICSAVGWIVMVCILVNQSNPRKDYRWQEEINSFILFIGFPVCILLTWCFTRIVSNKRWKKDELFTLVFLSLSFPSAIIILVYMYMLGTR